jgi:hypothetical protein
MLLECQSADVDHAVFAVAVPPPPCCVYGGPLDPCAGWDLVQRDWTVRQREAVVRRSGLLARVVGVPIAAVHALVRSLARC